MKKSFSRLLPGFLLAAATVLQAQTYYWNPDSLLLASGGEAQKAFNWTTGKDGTGAWPKSAQDDDFTANTLGAAWTFVDSAHSSTASSYSLTANSGQLTLAGRGADLWLTNNDFTAIYRKDSTGDFDVSVKVISQTAPDSWSKSGILIYNDFKNIAAGGGFTVFVSGNAGVKVQYDSLLAGTFDAPVGVGVGPAGPTMPCWLRAVKKGGTYWGFYRSRLDTAWALVGTYATLDAAPNAQVGIFTTSHNTSTTNIAVFDDFQAGGNIQATTLDLNFGGTSPKADENARLVGSLSLRNLDMTGYTGLFSFLTSTLSVSGNAQFGATVNIAPGTGGLTFNATSGIQVFTPKPSDLYPPINKTGKGTVQITSKSLRAGKLTIADGALDLGSHSHEFAGLATTGGSIKGLTATDTLVLTGDADFSGLTAFPTTGHVQIRAKGDGKINQFNPGAIPFPNLYLWPHATGTLPAKIVISAGNLQVKGALTLRDEMTAAGIPGVVDFGSFNPNVSVDGNLVMVPNGAVGELRTMALLMGSGNWTTGSNIDLFLNPTLAIPGSAGGSTLKLAGAIAQVVKVTGSSLNAVEHSSPGALKLGAALSAASLIQSAGTFDFNNFDVTVSGNLQVTKGSVATFIGLGGRKLTVGGTAAFTGTVGSHLNLNPASGWIINATGALTADSADIGNSSADLTTGIATKNCVDKGGNVKWTFPTTTDPPLIVREPTDSAVVLGKPVSFSVLATGSGTLTYQWYRKGVIADIGLGTSYALSATTLADDGALFYCIVSSVYGKDTTRVAKLTVNEAAHIVREPKSISVGPGKKAAFTVGAAGTGPLAFAWRIKGNATVLSVDSTYSIDSAKSSQNGSIITVIVSNAFGADTSIEALLTVSACDSLFKVTPDTLDLEESQRSFIAGTVHCSDGHYWSVVSGPAPRIVNLDADTLPLSAPRVAGDTVIVYRFTAFFGAVQQTKDVVVHVREAIPDPVFVMPPDVQWSGSPAMVIKPKINNAAALSGSKYPAPLHYVWRLSQAIVDTSLKGDSLTLSNPTLADSFSVELCLDNGGAVTCQRTKIIVAFPVSLNSPRGFNLGPVALSGSTFLWSAPAWVRIWNFQGKIIWQSRGSAGGMAELPMDVYRSLRQHRARIEIRP